jgi:hypothetical protein
MERVEVRSKNADSHLGQLFDEATTYGTSPLHQFCIFALYSIGGFGKSGLGEYVKLFNKDQSEKANHPRGQKRRIQIISWYFCSRLFLGR